jgi:hypothetical protein
MLPAARYLLGFYFRLIHQGERETAGYFAQLRKTITHSRPAGRPALETVEEHEKFDLFELLRALCASRFYRKGPLPANP